MNQAFPLVALMTVIGCLPVVAQQGTPSPAPSRPVGAQMLLDGLKDTTQWLMFGGDYTSRRKQPSEAVDPTKCKSTDAPVVVSDSVARAGAWS